MTLFYLLAFIWTIAGVQNMIQARRDQMEAPFLVIVFFAWPLIALIDVSLALISYLTKNGKG